MATGRGAAMHQVMCDKVMKNLEYLLKRAFIEAGKHDYAGAFCTDGTGTQIHYK